MHPHFMTGMQHIFGGYDCLSVGCVNVNSIDCIVTFQFYMHCIVIVLYCVTHLPVKYM